MRPTLRRLVPAAMTVFLLVAGCGGSAANTGTANSAPTAAPTPTPEPAVVVTASVMVAGQPTTILTNTAGMTLYRFAPDQGGKITCLAACLANWPGLFLPATNTKAVGGPGVTGTLATLTNPEKNLPQVTYNGWPLYTWIKDTKPGDATGQGVGGKWSVVAPDIASGA